MAGVAVTVANHGLDRPVPLARDSGIESSRKTSTRLSAPASNGCPNLLPPQGPCFERPPLHKKRIPKLSSTLQGKIGLYHILKAFKAPFQKLVVDKTSSPQLCTIEYLSSLFSRIY